MNNALIFAGGSGVRMNKASRPKQFLELHGKEIIIYTLEHFESHPEVDAIAVVCLESWIPFLREILERYRLGKVRWIVPGGSTGQLSIRNGIKALERDCPGDSLVLIHDGVRPLIDSELISENIRCARENGSAVSVAPAVETIVTMTEDGMIKQVMDRKSCYFAKAPQTFRLSAILAAHEKAILDGHTDMIDSASLMSFYGHNLYTVPCTGRNIKITTPGDYYSFKALVEAEETSQIFGL